MAKNNIASKIVYSFFKIFFSVSENPSREINPPKKNFNSKATQPAW